MNKGELIEKVASVTESSKAVAAKAVKTIFDTISKTLKKGENVTIVGFGTFSVVKQKARKGRNPITGESIKIKARKSPRFKAGKGLKEIVAGKKK
ncbi:DNA-binding protein HU-beta [hydrothermal vent metagenome]|uniref:DNA-binding protein HU-beta n=1 Tax=hydrothermal vent metagenome TaxID=652676 RepID=A0A3B1DHX5_9ZZZZ